MTAAITVRLMQREDAVAVADLSEQLGYPATVPEIEQRFDAIAARGDAQVFVAAEPDGRVVGWIHIYCVRLLESDLHGEIGGLVIAEGMRGHGAGHALVSAAEAWAARAGCQTVRVRSQVKREGAHRFYERVGYGYLKTQKNFQKVL
jgi:GNAT superfamily N-acetyltransferase